MKRMSIFRIAIWFLAGVTMLTLLAGITAAGRDRMAREETAYYRQQERHLVEEVREYLTEKGYSNSGIMLTHVDHKDGTREYRLTIHHARIDQLEEAAREVLLKELSAFSLPGENCSCQPTLMVRGDRGEK